MTHNLQIDLNLLIDADLLVYRAAHAAEQTTDYEMGTDSSGYPFQVSTRTCLLAESSLIFEDMVEQLLADLKSVEYTLAFTDSLNYRKVIASTYKANRKASAKPVGLSALRQYALDHHPTWIVPTLEADDVLGMAMTNPKASEKSVICSIDKDLLTIPGLHYNWDKPERGVVRVTPAEAFRTFLGQCLTGDSTDGYQGLKGVGPVKAMKILDTAAKEGLVSWRDAVLPAWIDAGHTEEEALTCARLARILRFEDFDHVQGEPRLYTGGN